MFRSVPFRLALALATACGGGALAVAPASAGGVSDQEKTVQQVLAEIDRMHEKVDQYNEDIVVALGEKAELDAQIIVAQGQIAVQQAQINELEVQLGNVAVEKVMGGGSGALGPLFTDPVALDEGLQRDHLARVAVNAGAATNNDYEVLLAALEDEQKSLEDKQAQAASLAEQAEVSRVKAEQALSDLEARQIKERAKLGDLLQEEQDRQAAAAAAEYQRQVAEAQAKAQAQAQASPGGSSGSGSSGGTTSGGTTSGGAPSSGSPAAGSPAAGSPGTGSGSGSDDGGSSGGGGGSSVPPVSSRASIAVNAASSQMGVPYRFATSSPGVGFDCSGLTAYAWGVAGVGLPHQSGQQYASTPHVPKEQAQPGDLIFYYSPIGHVGIYIGGGSMIHAPSTGKTVSVGTVRWDKVVGVSRPG